MVTTHAEVCLLIDIREKVNHITWSLKYFFLNKLHIGGGVKLNVLLSSYMFLEALCIRVCRYQCHKIGGESWTMYVKPSLNSDELTEKRQGP